MFVQPQPSLLMVGCLDIFGNLKIDHRGGLLEKNNISLFGPLCLGSIGCNESYYCICQPDNRKNFGEMSLRIDNVEALK